MDGAHSAYFRSVEPSSKTFSFYGFFIYLFFYFEICSGQAGIVGATPRVDGELKQVADGSAKSADTRDEGEPVRDL
jgi:hypothetical protein